MRVEEWRVDQKMPMSKEKLIPRTSYRTGGSRQQVSINTRSKTSLVGGICEEVTQGVMDTVRRMRGGVPRIELGAVA